MVSVLLCRVIYTTMATLSYNLSRKADKATGRHEILARFVVGSRINQRAKTNIFAPADYWNEETQTVTVPARRLMNEAQRKEIEALHDINTRLQKLRAAVMEAFIEAGAGKHPLPQGWLSSTIDRYIFPQKYEIPTETWYLTDAFEDYFKNTAISAWRVKHTKVVLRSLLRYEAMTGIRMELDTVTADDIRAFEAYVRKEGEIVGSNPEIMKVCPESRKIEARSDNTISERMMILRTVFLYAVKNGRTNNNPFNRYEIPAPVYGTPYYITIEERNNLYNFDLSSRPTLAIQRDIFVFQCLIGCRVSDLLKLTRNNLIAGAIEYIPRKTKDDRPTTVRVPLNAIAKEIVERYKDEGRAALLPFISSQQYNNAIKEAFTLAGLTRMVTVLDPQSRQEVQRPLNEIASSHLARRTFVGNLYKQVKDPNLIAKLSGHVEGSRAFARYRDIDEEMRQDLVKMLE